MGQCVAKSFFHTLKTEHVYHENHAYEKLKSPSEAESYLKEAPSFAMLERIAPMKHTQTPDDRKGSVTRRIIGFKWDQ